MTPKKIIAAYQAIRELAGVTFPFKTAREVSRLKRAIDTEFDCVCRYEAQLREKHGGKLGKDGITFSTHEAAEAFKREYDDFLSEGIDVDLPQADVSRYTEFIRLTASALEALDGIVKFEEGDNG